MNAQAVAGLFAGAIAIETAARLWLATRQIAAVRAHRDRVPEPFSNEITLADQQKAADYTVARTRLGRVGFVVEASIALALTFGGGIALLDAFWSRLALGQPWHGTLVVLTTLLAILLIRLPLAAWRTFRIEARFGFNRVSPALFLADFVKRMLLGLLLTAPLLLIVLALLEGAGPWWWVTAWAVWVGATLGLGWAWPRIIAPLFNRFTPLADSPLKSRVEALLARCGFASSGLFVMDGSRRSAHGNAYFTGVGRNKRIVLFDTLLQRLDAAEVEAVLAHELGHFRLQHVRKRLILSIMGGFFGFAGLAWLAEQPELYPALGVPAAPHSALLVFMLIAPLFAFLWTPVASWWSRRHELAADDFAVAHVDARALAGALIKLHRDNASTLTPDPLHSAFYDSHPPAPVRVSRLIRVGSPFAESRNQCSTSR